MAGPTPTVKREDITLYEETEYINSEYGVGPRTYWLAALDGASSTGERVEVSRSAYKAVQAMKNLEAAIREQGWEID